MMPTTEERPRTAGRSTEGSTSTVGSPAAGSRMSKTPPCRVMVCVGGPCRKARGHGQLVRLAAQSGNGATVACQGICDGPVVGLEIAGATRWYRRIRGSRRRSLVVEALRKRRVDARLKSREVANRRNELRHPKRLVLLDEPAQ